MQALVDPRVLIPLIATIAYVPLFVVLLTNRPWQQRHKLFLWFLIPAVLWSLITFLGMFFIIQNPSIANLRLQVGIVICVALLVLVQFHYLVRSFYQAEAIRMPLAYVFLVAAAIVVALPNRPDININFDIRGGAVTYGYGVIAIYLLFLSIVGIRDIYSLVHKRMLSANPIERNQIVYLLACIAIFTVFFLGGISGGEFPISHIGNLIVACILTYAVVTHRLADFNVVFRQGFMYVALYGSGVGILLLAFWLTHRASPEFQRYFPSLALAIAIGIPAILFFAHKVRDLWQRKVEDTFVGAKSFYRRQLSEFIEEMYSTASLDDLGKRLISLLGDSIDCRRACLLLPEDGEDGFQARFIYPSAEGNPIRALKLGKDSPVVTWLERSKTILTERSLAILPEFQAMWETEREPIKLAEVKMFIPLVHEGKLVAILAVSERRDGKPYSVEDIDLLESFSRQVATSVQKEYARERLKEQEQERALLNSLTRIMTSNVSIETIFGNFAQALKEVADADWVTIGLIDGDKLRFTALSSVIGSAWQPGEEIPLEGTGTEAACRERHAVYEPDLKRQHRFWTGESHLKQGIRSIVYLPLNIADHPIGSLILASRRPDAYTNRQIRLLESVASHIAAPIENAHLYSKLEQKSRVDELTGLFNRRYFEERLKEELSRHSRYGDVFSMLMIDLDNFKAYNDVYGHPAGDVLLGQIGRIIKSCIRSVDLAFRYGGDEFVIVLPQTPRDAAHLVAERVRSQIAKEMEKKAVAVTCSIGLASYPADAILSGELVDAADDALYQAKRTGGNRVFFSSKVPPKPADEAQATGIVTSPSTASEIYDMASAVEAKDPYTYGHARKVKTYAMALAEKIGLSPDEVCALSAAALLHDIGKVGISERVFRKKGKLGQEDWEAIKAHPRLGANIVSNISALAPCINGILYHHERWDGSGYPEGLKGVQIPLEARILAIADSFDAMTSARPYRPALSIQEVVTELRQGAGSQFDPKLVEAFIEIVGEGLAERAKTG